MKYLLTLLLIVSLNVLSVPKGYVNCCVNDNGSEFFFDPSTIDKDGTKRRFWMGINYSTPMQNKFKSSRSYKEIDCNKKTIQSLDLHVFEQLDFGGELLIVGGDDQIVFIPPRSIYEFFMNYVCGD